jgi:hypothetical protein
LDLAKVVVPTCAFLVGLGQYRKAQAWKRMEFVAQQIERFRADVIVRRVLTMLDWGERRIDLGIPFEPNLRSGELKPPRITYRLIGEALRTHHGNQGGFSSLEAAIRDHFDQFLDYLSHFEHFIQAGLVKPKDIRPYLDYWTSALAGNDEVNPELLTQFWRFVDGYGYSKVRQLICRFHPEAAGRFPLWSPDL